MEATKRGGEVQDQWQRALRLPAVWEKPLMCGIAGIATRNGLQDGDRQLVERMLKVLAHRGPDDQHHIADGRAIIGSRRLSIIDLETGRQPLSNEDGTVWVSQNGEIYNYVELRDELVRRGHRFATRGDTETIVHLYEEYGDEFVHHLRGMFAVAIWDAGRGRLVLARDRLGKKPLYWHLSNGRLTYGSELKALLEDDSVSRTVDRQALAMYLQYQYVPSPHTILAGVQKLAPAHLLSWDGGEPQVHRYWELTYEPKDRRTLVEDRELCLSLLRESVRLRLRSDVPVGIFLSGGMDSSVVTALAAEASPTPVTTYSIGFDDRDYDELPYARSIARHFATRHIEEVVRLDAIELLPKLAEHYDEPFADSSAIPTFRVAQLAARDLKVVLTGDGGDETFGGYDRYRFQAGMDALASIPTPLRRLAISSAQAIVRRTRSGARLRRRSESWANLVPLSSDHRYVYLMSIFGSEVKRQLLGDEEVAEQDRYLLDVLATGPGGSLDRLLRADTLTYLPEDLLVKVDRATMANSLEARAPLLDHHLVEFAAKLPADRKIRRGVAKAILRDVAAELLPPRHLDRPKMGFGVPVAQWFRGELGERYRDLVLAPESSIRDHLDQTVAAGLLSAHRSGRAEHGARLWSLLMFEMWARTWLPARTAAVA